MLVIVRVAALVVVLLCTALLAAFNPAVLVVSVVGTGCGLILVALWTRSGWAGAVPAADTAWKDLLARHRLMRLALRASLFLAVSAAVILAGIFGTAFLVLAPTNDYTLPYSAELSLDDSTSTWSVTERYTLSSDSRTLNEIRADLGRVPPGWRDAGTVNGAPVIARETSLGLAPNGLVAATSWATFHPTILSGAEVRYLPSDPTVALTAPRLAIVETEPKSDETPASRGQQDERRIEFPDSALTRSAFTLNIRSLDPRLRNDLVYRLATLSSSAVALAVLFGLWNILVAIFKSAVQDRIKGLLTWLASRGQRKPMTATAP